jgi:protease I
VDKVLLVIGDAAEVFDTLYPLYRIREDGYQVLVAAPEKRIYHLVMHEAHPDWDITVESPGYKLASDVAFRDIRPEEYAGMVLSGGRAPEYLRYDADLMRIVRYLCEKNLPVASVCHGIEILATADVIRGKTVTTVAKCRFDAEVSGARYVNQEVVVSSNLVTARTWQDNHAFMREFMRLLNSKRLRSGEKDV